MQGHRPPSSFPRVRPLVLALAAVFATGVEAADAVQTVAPTVTVIGQTPLPGLEQPVSHIPAPVQSFTARFNAGSLSVALNMASGGDRTVNGLDDDQRFRDCDGFGNAERKQSVGGFADQRQ